MKNLAARALILGLLLATTPDCVAAPSKKTEKKVEAAPQELVIDAIVGSVDDKPITLSDLNARLAPRRLTLAEAGKEPEASRVLDQIILEKLLEEEAKAKRVNVTDAEVQEYLQEVMQRNGLSEGEFQAALAKEGRSVSAYKQQIKILI